MEYNEVLERLPRHLLSLVIDQPYNDYTAQDHAVWRYVMRQNVKYLPHVAHHSYLDGLRRTGISIESIPHMYGMNRILREIGWAAVAVDGFIPPAAFMEFQAYNVLVIAADIRPVDQISYTPAPDIIHEAAGHAPIIADTEYATYLRDFGKTGSLAFASKYDDQVYEAIRHLSILKADPYSGKEIIEQAEAELDRLSKLSSGPSEMALLRNLHWWTVEYGLIGELKHPRIYGAGLLSSISESYNCLQDRVKKIPYSLEARLVNFDITTEQPQLFVASDFFQLNEVLEEYASGMAFRTGGLPAVRKAIESGSLCTVQYSSGLQVSGMLTGAQEFRNEPAYLSFTGPVALSVEGRMLPGHDQRTHPHGFGSPAGRMRNLPTSPEWLSTAELEAMGLVEERKCSIAFESGVEVDGVLRHITRHEGRILLLSFSDCVVTRNGSVLFEPSWGIYDMAVGEAISSCFSGVADPDAFDFSFPVPAEKTHKIIHSESSRELHRYYSLVREIREKGNGIDGLAAIFQGIKDRFPADWLLPLEIYELISSKGNDREFGENVLRHLKQKAVEEKGLLKLIQDGLLLCNS